MSINFQTTYNVRGSPGGQVDLTGSFVATNPIFSRYCKAFHIEGTYTPKTDGAHMLMLIEYSNDAPTATPTNFRPLSVQIPSTTEVDLYENLGYSMGTASGIPIVIPGSKTTTHDVDVKWEFDNSELVSTWLRLSFMEVGGVTPGKTDAEITVQNL